MNSVGRGLEPAPTNLEFHDSRDDFVRILSQLTQEFERFDSMVRNQRHLLQQHGAASDSFDDRLIRRQSKRISAGAAEIVTRTLSALEELRGVSHTGEFVSSETIEQQVGGRRAVEPT